MVFGASTVGTNSERACMPLRVPSPPTQMSPSQHFAPLAAQDSPSLTHIARSAFLAEGDKRQLYTDYVDAAGTRKNAMSIVTAITPEQKKLVQDILARAR